MSLSSVIGEYENHYRNQVIAHAFGHLAPKPQEKYKGLVVFCLSAFGDITVIDYEFDGLDDSPWFYDDLHEFAGNQIDNDTERGTIFTFRGTYKKFKNGNFRFSGKITKKKEK